jgi:murein DD-endopeptidase MepM/ murein hydrolase activator NlpD
MERVRAHFRPEFINRVDDIIFFHSLNKDHLKQIVRIQLANFRERLTELGIDLTIDDKAAEYLAEAWFDPVYGARPLKRIIVKEIETLNITQKESEKVISGFKKKIGKVNKVVSIIRKDTEVLYSGVIDKRAPFLWAKGGAIIIPNELKNEVNHRDIPMEIYDLLDRIREVGVVKDVLNRVKKFLLLRKPIIQNMPSIWPVYGQIVSVLPGDNGVSIGIDIETLPGLGIKATAPGKVSSVVWKEKEGITVEIEHKYGFKTTYSHLLSSKIDEGDEVKKGEIIGYVGNTGGVHNYICHYEIYIGLYPVNPVPYLNKID